MFDGYQEELSTKGGAHERRTAGRAGPTVDFTRDMVVKSKKRRTLIQQGQQEAIHYDARSKLEHVRCETRHAKGGADVLIEGTTVLSAMFCETTSVGDDTDLIVLLCFHVKEDSCELFFKPDMRSRTKKSP